MAPIPALRTVAILDMADAKIRARIGDSLVSLGQKGDGPGELSRPAAFSVRGRSAAVLDRAGRIVWMNLDDTFPTRRANYTASCLYPSLAILDDGSVVVPSAEYPGFIGVRVQPDEDPEPWGAAPSLSHDRDATLNIVSRVGNVVVVMNNADAKLWVYTAGGERTDSLPLPEDIVRQVDLGLEELRADGSRVVGNPYVIGMHALSEDWLFLRLTPLEGVPIGLVADLTHGMEEIINAGRLRADDKAIVRGASSLVVFERTMFALTRNEVYSFGLSTSRVR